MTNTEKSTDGGGERPSADTMHDTDYYVSGKRARNKKLHVDAECRTLLRVGNTNAREATAREVEVLTECQQCCLDEQPEGYNPPRYTSSILNDIDATDDDEWDAIVEEARSD